MCQFSKVTQHYLNETLTNLPVTVLVNRNRLPNALCAQAVCSSHFPRYVIESVAGKNINYQTKSIFILKVTVSILYKAI